MVVHPYRRSCLCADKMIVSPRGRLRGEVCGITLCWKVGESKEEMTYSIAGLYEIEPAGISAENFKLQINNLVLLI